MSHALSVRKFARALVAKRSFARLKVVKSQDFGFIKNREAFFRLCLIVPLVEAGTLTEQPLSRFEARLMADDWDDWGDGEARSDTEKSEGWDWPTEAGYSAESTAAVVLDADTNSKSRCLPDESNQNGSDEGLETEAQLARQVDEMTDNYFSELQKYQEDLADQSVREEINKVQRP